MTIDLLIHNSLTDENEWHGGWRIINKVAATDRDYRYNVERIADGLRLAEVSPDCVRESRKFSICEYFGPFRRLPYWGPSTESTQERTMITAYYRGIKCRIPAYKRKVIKERENWTLAN